MTRFQTMKWFCVPLTAAIVLIAPLAALRAENGEDNGQPPPPPPHDGGGPDGREDGPRRNGPPGGPGGMMPPPPPEMRQLARMQSYLDVVDRFAKLSRDRSASGVAAVVMAGDVLRRKGPQAQIDYFNQTLPKVDDLAVRNAIRLQLVDLYRATGEQDKATDLLTQLILESKGSNPNAGQ